MAQPSQQKKKEFYQIDETSGEKVNTKETAKKFMHRIQDNRKNEKK